MNSLAVDIRHEKTWIIAKVIVASSEGKILALRRSDTAPHDPLKWDFPGGVVEFGEDPTLAAMRECLEECSLHISGLTPISVTSANGPRGYAVVIIYGAKTDSTAVQLSYEHDKSKWVTPEAYLELDAPDVLKLAVRDWQARGM